MLSKGELHGIYDECTTDEAEETVCEGEQIPRTKHNRSSIGPTGYYIEHHLW